MKIYKDIEQLSDEWYQIRCGKITGSSMADLLAGGKGKTRNSRLYKLVAERITGKRCEQDFKGNFHTERGHDLESDAKLVYEMRTGNKVETVGFVDAERDFLGYSPDGLMLDIKGGLEIKCKDSHTFVEQKLLGIKAIEKRYIIQMHVGMIVCELDWIDYVCYNPNFDDPYIVRIEKDELLIKEIEDGIKKANQDIDKIIKQIGEN